MLGELVHHRRRAWAAAVVTAAALVGFGACGDGGGAGTRVSFRLQIQPIFDRSCVSCHPAAYPYLDLHRGRSYAQLVRVSARTAPSYERVVPGRPGLSYLLIHPPEPSRRHLLTGHDRALIAAWIRQGATDN